MIAASASMEGLRPVSDKIEGAVLLASVADPVRLQILAYLSKGELNVTQLCSLLKKRQQAVSHHLTILKLRKLVMLIRRGKSNYYRLHDYHEDFLMGLLVLLRQFGY